MKKISIIGSTIISEHHIDAFRQAGMEILSCASSKNSKNIKKFSKKKNIKKFFLDPFELISSDDWDGLIIASSINSIPKILDHAIKKGKPILVEKPVSLGVNYLKKFKKNNIQNINVAFNRRYYSSINIAKKFLFNSKNKCIINIKIPEKVFQYKKNKFKKFLNVYNNSCHIFDIIFYLLDDVRILHKSNNLKNNNSKIVLLKSIDNHLCNLLLNYNSPDNLSIEIENGNQRLLLKPLEKYYLYQGMQIFDPTNKFPLRLYKPKLINQGDIFSVNTKRLIKPGFLEQAKDFKRVLYNKKSRISAKLYDAYRAQNLINEIL